MAEKKLVFNLTAEKDDSVSSSIREITQELTDVRKLTSMTLTLDIDPSVNRSLDQISSRLDDIRAKANIPVTMSESGNTWQTQTRTAGGRFGPRKKGFAQGGYTGSGYDDQPAGIVHANEYVIPAEVVRKVGPGYFDALSSKLRGYAEGGLVEDDWNSGDVFKDIWESANQATGTGASIAGVDAMTGGHGANAVRGALSRMGQGGVMGRLGSLREAAGTRLGGLAIAGTVAEVGGRIANSSGEYMVNNYGNAMERRAMQNEAGTGLHSIPVIGQGAGAVSKITSAITTRGDMFGSDFRNQSSVFDSTDGTWGGRLNQIKNIGAATVTGRLGWESMKYMTGGKQNLEDAEAQNKSQEKRLKYQEWEKRFYDQEGKNFAEGSSEALHARGAMFANQRSIRNLKLGTTSERSDEINSALEKAQLGLSAADKRVQDIKANPLKQMEGATLPAAIAEQKQAEEEVLKLLKEQGSIQKEIGAEKKKSLEDSLKSIEHAQKQLEIEAKMLERRATANQNAQDTFADMDELEKANAKDAMAKLERGEKLDSTERGYIKGLVGGSPEMQAKYDQDARQSVIDEGEKMKFLTDEESVVKAEQNRVGKRQSELAEEATSVADDLESLQGSIDEGTTKVSETMKAIFERYSQELTEKLNAGLNKAETAEERTQQYQHRNDATRITQEAN